MGGLPTDQCPKPNEDQGTAPDQANPAALPDQEIADHGDTEGRQRGVDRIAGGDPEPGDEAAMPAAGERATEDQEEDRAR